MAFWYSVRLRRRNVSVRPGFGLGGGGGIERGFERGQQGFVGVLVGPRQSGGRHGAGAELADDLLPVGGVLVDTCDVEVIERESAGLHLAVVAAGTIPLHGLFR